VDIIHECDTVQVKLKAYPFTRYGVVPAVLEPISRDAIEDKEYSRNRGQSRFLFRPLNLRPSHPTLLSAL
jgi:hypothetical protein